MVHATADDGATMDDREPGAYCFANEPEDIGLVCCGQTRETKAAQLLGKLILRQLPVEVFQIRSSYSLAEVIHVPLSPIIDADAGLVAQIAPV